MLDCTVVRRFNDGRMPPMHRNSVANDPAVNWLSSMNGRVAKNTINASAIAAANCTNAVERPLVAATLTFNLRVRSVTSSNRFAS